MFKFKFKNPFTKKLRGANESLNEKIAERDREIIRLRGKVQRMQDEYDWFRNNPPKFKVDEVIGHYKVVSFKIEKNNDYDKRVVSDAILTLLPTLFRLPKTKITVDKTSKKPLPQKYFWVYEIRPLADLENENYRVLITEENLLFAKSLKKK